MHNDFLVAISSIVVLGIAAQWLSWLLRLPAVLLLIVVGIIIGPVGGYLNPDEILSDLLVPIVSLSVAIILFEGGLTLKLKELRSIGTVVRRLISLGMLINFLISSVAAKFILGLNTGLSVMLGAILVVTGPTVISPLLRHVRPAPRLASILRWEGILIDPIGAVFAVLVFEAIFSVDLHSATLNSMLDLLQTLLVGGGLGILGAVFITVAMKNYWIPDFLLNPVALMTLTTTFTLSNLLQAESGLLAATIMGISLANQNYVSIQKISAFKETLQVLLISSLFIILTARLELSDLYLPFSSLLLYLLVLIMLARPASVLISTINAGLNWRERIFLALIAPRGIVAVAVSSIFALRLISRAYPQSEDLIPITFLVVIATIVFYSIIALPLTRLLALSQPDPRGILIVGAHYWARKLAIILQEEGFDVIIVDTNAHHIEDALDEKIQSYHGDILSEDIYSELDLSSIGRLFALTANDEVNSLASVHFSADFGAADVYQIPLQQQIHVPRDLRGRFLLNKELSYSYIETQVTAGAQFKVFKGTEAINLQTLIQIHENKIVPLFIFDEYGRIIILNQNKSSTLKTGQKLFYMELPSRTE